VIPFILRENFERGKRCFDSPSSLLIYAKVYLQNKHVSENKFPMMDTFSSRLSSSTYPCVSSIHPPSIGLAYHSLYVFVLFRILASLFYGA
jgi:hypothetical protein